MELFGFEIKRKSPPKITARRYEGASGGRRWDSAPSTLSPIADAHDGRRPIAARARHFDQNCGFAAKISSELTSALIGTGYGVQSIHPDPNIRKDIEDRFYYWQRRADFHGRTNFGGISAQAVRSWCVAGESFVQLKNRNGAIALALLDPEQIDPAKTIDLGGGARIVAGVEFDKEGRRVAYHILRDPPGQVFASIRESVRVPAEEIIHLFTPLAPGQVRGVSWFAPSLLKLHEYDQTSDAILIRTKTSACLSAFVVDPEGNDGALSGSKEDQQGRPELEIEPGVVFNLRPGEDIRFNDPPDIGAETVEFLKWQAREIAAGVGVTYEMATGDLSGVNYSSIRAGAIDFRRRIDSLRVHHFVPLFLEPIWRRFLVTEALANRLPADAILSDFETASAVEFIPPAWSWIDPAKEIAADREAVAAGFKSRREVVAGRGRDIDALDAEIADDKKRAKALGIEFGTLPPAKEADAPAEKKDGGDE